VQTLGGARANHWFPLRHSSNACSSLRSATSGSAKCTQGTRFNANSGWHLLQKEKIDAVIDSAKATLGVPQLEAEREVVQNLAGQVLHYRQLKAKAEVKIRSYLDKMEYLLSSVLVLLFILNGTQIAKR
jgi:hypothetical protein